MASFDTALFKAVNGDDGGTWAPANQIILGGSGLSVTGASAFSNITAATVNGTLTVANGGFLAIAAGATLDMLTGATATWNGTAAITFSSTAQLLFTSTSVFSAANGTTVSIGGAVSYGPTAAVTHASAATIDYGGATASGRLTRTGQTILSGGSGGIGWRKVDLTTGDQPVDATTGDVFTIPTALVADSAYSLTVPADTTAGWRALFTRKGDNVTSAFTATIYDNAANAVATWGPVGSPYFQTLEVIWNVDAQRWLKIRSTTGL
jgi:hypothetical protein